MWFATSCWCSVPHDRATLNPNHTLITSKDTGSLISQKAFFHYSVQHLESTKVYLGSDELGSPTNRATHSLIVQWQVSGLTRGRDPWNTEQTCAVLIWELLLLILFFHLFYISWHPNQHTESVFSGLRKWILWNTDNSSDGSKAMMDYPYVSSCSESIKRGELNPI